jgi:hypothetical protein
LVLSARMTFIHSMIAGTGVADLSRRADAIVPICAKNGECVHFGYL